MLIICENILLLSMLKQVLLSTFVKTVTQLSRAGPGSVGALGEI